MRRDGTGFELLRHQDVDEYLKAAKDNVATAVLRTPVEGLPNVTGVTVLKPFSGGEGRKWLKHKDESNLVPLALRERDFTQFPPTEKKKDGPKFGTNAGVFFFIVILMFHLNFGPKFGTNAGGLYFIVLLMFHLNFWYFGIVF